MKFAYRLQLSHLSGSGEQRKLPLTSPRWLTSGPERSRLGMYREGQEEFVNLQGLLVHSSKSFGISSVQFSSLVTRLSGKFIQFSSGHRSQMPSFSRFSSFSSVQKLLRPWFGLTWLSRFGSASVQSIRSPIVLEEPF